MVFIFSFEQINFKINANTDLNRERNGSANKKLSDMNYKFNFIPRSQSWITFDAVKENKCNGND